MKIGILAVQGAFAEHKTRLEKLGADCFEIRNKADLEQSFDGLVLPGGESTVQGKMLRELGMFDDLKNRIENGLPVLATCAGLILLAEKLEKRFQVSFPKGEVDNLALHLVGHRVTEKYGFGNSNIVISQDIYDLVLEIIQFINYTLKIDLRRDLNTIMNLAIHMVSLDIRLKYNSRLKNPSLNDIKKNYVC